MGEIIDAVSVLGELGLAALAIGALMGVIYWLVKNLGEKDKQSAEDRDKYDKSLERAQEAFRESLAQINSSHSEALEKSDTRADLRQQRSDLVIKSLEDAMKRDWNK